MSEYNDTPRIADATGKLGSDPYKKLVVFGARDVVRVVSDPDSPQADNSYAALSAALARVFWPTPDPEKAGGATAFTGEAIGCIIGKGDDGETYVLPLESLDTPAPEEYFQKLLRGDNFDVLSMDERDIPAQWQGVMLRGSKPGEPDDRLMLPLYEMIADHVEGGDFSVPVYEMASDGTEAAAQHGRLHSVFRVAPLPQVSCAGPSASGDPPPTGNTAVPSKNVPDKYAVALVMGPAGADTTGHGLATFRSARNKLRLACLGYLAGGPLTGLHENTKHKLGNTDAGRLSSAGISTSAIFALGGEHPEKEGMLLFDSLQYEQPISGGKRRMCHIVWNPNEPTKHPCGDKPGRWEIHVKVPLFEVTPSPVVFDSRRPTHFTYFPDQIDVASVTIRDPNPNGDPSTPITGGTREGGGGGETGGGGGGSGGGGSTDDEGGGTPITGGNRYGGGVPLPGGGAIDYAGGVGVEWPDDPDGKPRDYESEGYVDSDGDGRVSYNERKAQDKAKRDAEDAAEAEAKAKEKRQKENKKVLDEIKEREDKRKRKERLEKEAKERREKRDANEKRKSELLRRIKKAREEGDDDLADALEAELLRRIGAAGGSIGSSARDERIKELNRQKREEAQGSTRIGSSPTWDLDGGGAESIVSTQPNIGDFVGMTRRQTDYGETKLKRKANRNANEQFETLPSADGWIGLAGFGTVDLTRQRPEIATQADFIVHDDGKIAQGTITPKADGVQDGWEQHVNDSGDLERNPYVDALVSDARFEKIDGQRQGRHFSGVITLAEVNAFGSTGEGEVPISGRIPAKSSLATVYVGANTAAGGVTHLDITAGTNSTADNVLSSAVDVTVGSLANREGNGEKMYLVDEADVGGLRIKLASTGGNLDAVTGLDDGIAYHVVYAAEPASPTIEVTVSLTLFSAPASGEPSASQSYTLKAGNLKSAVVVSAPNAFQLSTDDTNWLDELTLRPDVGKDGFERTIYVRLNSATSHSAGWQFAGNIEHTATDATQVDVAVSGSDVFRYNDLLAGYIQADISAGAIDEWIDNTGTYDPLVQASAPLQPTKSGDVVQFSGSQYLNIPQDLATAMSVDNPAILIVSTYASGVQYYISMRGTDELLGFYRDGAANLRGIDERDNVSRSGFVADSSGTEARWIQGIRNGTTLIGRDTATGNIASVQDAAAGPFNGGSSGTNRSTVGGTYGASFSLGLVGDIKTIAFFDDDISGDIADIIAALEAGGNA